MKFSTPLVALSFSGMLIAACGLMSPPHAPAPATSARLDVRPDGSLWQHDSAGDHPLAPAGQYETLPGLSGTLYLALDDATPQRLRVWECDPAGLLQREQSATDDAIADATTILEARRPRPDKLYARLHLSPAADVAVTLDLSTGESRSDLVGEGQD